MQCRVDGVSAACPRAASLALWLLPLQMANEPGPVASFGSALVRAQTTDLRIWKRKADRRTDKTRVGFVNSDLLVHLRE